MISAPAWFRLRLRVGCMLGALAGFNVLLWGWALIRFHDQPAMLATALLAWSFGLRHAVDADHIAAIDNVTRKLMQDGARPVSVGFFFALGHSAIVLLITCVVAVSAAAFKGHFAAERSVGGVISTLASSLFLLVIAAMNIVILRDVWQKFRLVQAGSHHLVADRDLEATGPLVRIFRPLFRLVSRSWHMMPVGFVFGLGFDTATEVSLLGMSATQASKGMPVWMILVFPIFFAAGMALVDTADGILMLGAYEWAFMRPIRKLYYNLTITSVSVVVALVVSGIEGLGLLADQLGLNGGVWRLINAMNDNFNALGFVIVGIFVCSWVISMAVYKLKRFEKMYPTTVDH